MLLFQGKEHDVEIKGKGPTISGRVVLAHDGVLLPNVVEVIEEVVEPEEDIPK